jgi:hypothetical protein
MIGFGFMIEVDKEFAREAEEEEEEDMKFS